MKMSKRPRMTLIAALLVAPLLAACVPVAVVGGATAGVMVAGDRRSLDQQTKDGELERLVERRLKENFGERINVSANAYERTLLLTGEVPTAELKAEVDALVKLTPNVARTVDEIQVRKLSESRWRANDALVSANVRTRLGQSGKLELSIIKVVTESNSVFLMGKVTQKEADDAIEIARTTQGVQRVVNLMDVVSEAEIARLKNGGQPAPPPAAR